MTVVVAGIVNVSLAFIAGSRFPPLGAVGVSALIGILGHEVSLVLFVLGLREIGAARAGPISRSPRLLARSLACTCCASSGASPRRRFLETESPMTLSYARRGRQSV